MRVRLMVAAVICLGFSMSAHAADDVQGKWIAKVAGQGQGESTVTFVFKVVGETLTGTLNNSQQPGDVELKEGKVSGDQITFSLTRNLGGTDIKVVWKGKLVGNEIKFTRTLEGGGPGGATEITATRATP